MKQTINFSQFTDGFGENYKDNFSYNGKRALYDFLINYEEDIDQEIEFDPVALCVEYSEYSNLEDLKKDYNIETMKELENKTTVIKIEGTEGFIIQRF